jgi:hypothetical protein
MRRLGVIIPSTRLSLRLRPPVIGSLPRPPLIGSLPPAALIGPRLSPPSLARFPLPVPSARRHPSTPSTASTTGVPPQTVSITSVFSLSSLISSDTRRVRQPLFIARFPRLKRMSVATGPPPVYGRHAPPSDERSTMTWPTPAPLPPWICWSSSPRTVSWSVRSVNTPFRRPSLPLTLITITGRRKGPYRLSARCGRSWHRPNSERSSTRATRPCVDPYRPTNRSRSSPCTRAYNAGGVPSSAER